MASFSDAIVLGYKNSFNFTGRSTRSEYWWFVLFTILGGFVAGLLSAVIPLLMVVYVVFYLSVLPASLSLLWRRVRDAGGSIWWPAAMWIALFASFAFLAITSGDGGVLSMLMMGVYLVAGLVCFVYTVLPTKDPITE